MKGPKYISQIGSLKSDLRFHLGIFALECSKWQVIKQKVLLILSAFWRLLILNGTNLISVVLWVMHLHIFSNANYIFDLKKEVIHIL